MNTYKTKQDIYRETEEHFRYVRSLEAKLRELVEAASAVDLFFQSGNNIPVERATIQADIWEPVQAALKAAKEGL